MHTQIQLTPPVYTEKVPASVTTQVSSASPTKREGQTRSPQSARATDVALQKRNSKAALTTQPPLVDKKSFIQLPSGAMLKKILGGDKQLDDQYKEKLADLLDQYNAKVAEFNAGPNPTDKSNSDTLSKILKTIYKVLEQAKHLDASHPIEKCKAALRTKDPNNTELHTLNKQWQKHVMMGVSSGELALATGDPAKYVTWTNLRFTVEQAVSFIKAGYTDPKQVEHWQGSGVYGPQVALLERYGYTQDFFKDENGQTLNAKECGFKLSADFNYSQTREETLQAWEHTGTVNALYSGHSKKENREFLFKPESFVACETFTDSRGRTGYRAKTNIEPGDKLNYAQDGTPLSSLRRLNLINSEEGIDAPRIAGRNIACYKVAQAIQSDVIIQSELSVHTVTVNLYKRNGDSIDDTSLQEYVTAYNNSNPTKQITAANIPRSSTRVAVGISMPKIEAKYGLIDGNIVLPPPGSKEEKTMLQDLEELHLLDLICGQSDRNPGNILIDKEGHVHAIDNDASFAAQAFSPNDLVNNYVEQFGDNKLLGLTLPHVITSTTRDKFAKLTPENLEKLLQGLINSKGIKAALSRLKIVQEHINKLEHYGLVIDEINDQNLNAYNQALMATSQVAARNHDPYNPFLIKRTLVSAELSYYARFIKKNEALPQAPISFRAQFEKSYQTKEQEMQTAWQQVIVAAKELKRIYQQRTNTSLPQLLINLAQCSEQELEPFLAKLSPQELMSFLKDVQIIFNSARAKQSELSEREQTFFIDLGEKTVQLLNTRQLMLNKLSNTYIAPPSIAKEDIIYAGSAASNKFIQQSTSETHYCQQNTQAQPLDTPHLAFYHEKQRYEADKKNMCAIHAANAFFGDQVLAENEFSQTKQTEQIEAFKKLSGEARLLKIYEYLEKKFPQALTKTLEEIIKRIKNDLLKKPEDKRAELLKLTAVIEFTKTKYFAQQANISNRVVSDKEITNWVIEQIKTEYPIVQINRNSVSANELNFVVQRHAQAQGILLDVRKQEMYLQSVKKLPEAGNIITADTLIDENALSEKLRHNDRMLLRIGGHWVAFRKTQPSTEYPEGRWFLIDSLHIESAKKEDAHKSEIRAIHPIKYMQAYFDEKITNDAHADFSFDYIIGHVDPKLQKQSKELSGEIKSAFDKIKKQTPNTKPENLNEWLNLRTLFIQKNGLQAWLHDESIQTVLYPYQQKVYQSIIDELKKSSPNQLKKIIQDQLIPLVMINNSSQKTDENTIQKQVKVTLESIIKDLGFSAEKSKKINQLVEEAFKNNTYGLWQTGQWKARASRTPNKNIKLGNRSITPINRLAINKAKNTAEHTGPIDAKKAQGILSSLHKIFTKFAESYNQAQALPKSFWELQEAIAKNDIDQFNLIYKKFNADDIELKVFFIELSKKHPGIQPWLDNYWNYLDLVIKDSQTNPQQVLTALKQINDAYKKAAPNLFTPSLLAELDNNILSSPENASAWINGLTHEQLETFSKEIGQCKPKSDPEKVENDVHDTFYSDLLNWSLPLFTLKRTAKEENQASEVQKITPPPRTLVANNLTSTVPNNTSSASQAATPATAPVNNANVVNAATPPSNKKHEGPKTQTPPSVTLSFWDKFFSPSPKKVPNKVRISKRAEPPTTMGTPSKLRKNNAKQELGTPTQLTATLSTPGVIPHLNLDRSVVKNLKTAEPIFANQTGEWRHLEALLLAPLGSEEAQFLKTYAQNSSNNEHILFYDAVRVYRANPSLDNARKIINAEYYASLNLPGYGRGSKVSKEYRTASENIEKLKDKSVNTSDANPQNLFNPLLQHVLSTLWSTDPLDSNGVQKTAKAAAQKQLKPISKVPNEQLLENILLTGEKHPQWGAFHDAAERGFNTDILNFYKATIKFRLNPTKTNAETVLKSLEKMNPPSNEYGGTATKMIENFKQQLLGLDSTLVASNFFDDLIRDYMNALMSNTNITNFISSVTEKKNTKKKMAS